MSTLTQRHAKVDSPMYSGFVQVWAGGRGGGANIDCPAAPIQFMCIVRLKLINAG